MPCSINYLSLSENETDEINKLLTVIVSEKDCIEIQPFLQNATVLAHNLPRRIREAFYDFKLHQSSEILIVNSYEIDQFLIGKTPFRHRPPNEVEIVNRYEVLHILFAALLGEPFSWTTIQNGYIINDVMPISEHRNLIASSGSDALFDLHTEDAFHPYAGDYLGLMCLRNPNNVNTVFSSVSGNDLSEKIISVLFEPRYIIGANIAQNVPVITHSSSIFFGNRKFPYIRVNLNLTKAVIGDSEAEDALELLKIVLRKNCTKVSFQSGDFCYIDNYKVVHGREPFNPNYDGRDRWLKRLYITSSFRMSAAFRNSPDDRLLTPF